jgi:serine phosphatase RsbU (regulator of sigma subunit)
MGSDTADDNGTAGPATDDRDSLVARRRRSDAEQNYSRIIEAAVDLLEQNPAPSVDQVAAAAGLGRATVYRHFPGRNELLETARRHALDAAAMSAAERPPAASRDGDGTPDNGAADLLNRVPPHQIGDQIVAEARRLQGVSSVALYVVDIDGSRLLRVAGSQEFPEELDAPFAVGPEIPRDGIANLRRMVAKELPGSIAAPLFLRGRAIGLLLAIGADQAALDVLARESAVAIFLAEQYTDVIALNRRRKPTSAAGEIQQNLLPPRIVQISGAALAGNVLPSYDVGGDWFDYAENSDGSWLAVADATGKGATAASLGALALGAFRAARRSGAGLEEAAEAIHQAIREVNESRAVVTAVLGRWHGPTATFSWINCGHPVPIVITTNGHLRALEGPDHGALGGSDSGPHWPSNKTRLSPGERLILYSDGITQRPTQAGAPFGLAGLQYAVAHARSGSAAATVKAIEAAVTDASTTDLEDDATLLVLAPTDAPTRA